MNSKDQLSAFVNALSLTRQQQEALARGIENLADSDAAALEVLLRTSIDDARNAVTELAGQNTEKADDALTQPHGAGSPQRKAKSPNESRSQPKGVDFERKLDYLRHFMPRIRPENLPPETRSELAYLIQRHTSGLPPSLPTVVGMLKGSRPASAKFVLALHSALGLDDLGLDASIWSLGLDAFRLALHRSEFELELIFRRLAENSMPLISELKPATPFDQGLVLAVPNQSKRPTQPLLPVGTKFRLHFQLPFSGFLRVVRVDRTHPDGSALLIIDDPSPGQAERLSLNIVFPEPSIPPFTVMGSKSHSLLIAILTRDPPPGPWPAGGEARIPESTMRQIVRALEIVSPINRWVSLFAFDIV
jgi:hypothetical protein